jgi:O-methyltransferase involved in polyketide biosynthesis
VELVCGSRPTCRARRGHDLWYFEEREDVGNWLGRHGWDVTVTPAEELMAGYDRRPPQDIEDAALKTLFVAAQRG